MRHIWFHLINIILVSNVIIRVTTNYDDQSLSSAQHCMTLRINAARM